MGIVLVQKHDIHRANVGVDRDVVACQILVDEGAVALIDDVLFHQCRTDAPGHAADHLRARRLRIENAANREHAEHSPDAHLAGVAVHCRFDEVRAEAGMRIARAELGGRDRAFGLRHTGGDSGLELPAGRENRRT